MSKQLTPIVDKNGVSTSRWKKPQVEVDPSGMSIPAVHGASSATSFADEVPGTTKGAQIEQVFQTELREPFDLAKFTEITNESQNKPASGLWLSERTAETKSYWEFMNGAWDEPMARHEVRLHPEANVLVIDSWNDYVAAVDTWPLLNEHDNLRPDYEAMAADGVDAIYLTENGMNYCDGRGWGAEADKHDGYQKLFHWELPSTCVINPDAAIIESISMTTPVPKLQIQDGEHSSTWRMDQLTDMMSPGVYRAQTSDGVDVDVIVGRHSAELLTEKTDLSGYEDQMSFAAAIQTARWYGNDDHPAVKALYSLKGKYEMLGVGRNRCVFDVGDGYVIKVPINPEGSWDNLTESKHQEEYIPLADCWIEEREGMSVLMMAKVMPFTGDHSELPEWTKSVDCAQVGHDGRGRLVAYDL